MEEDKKTIDISTLTFVKIIVILVAIGFILMVKEVILLIFLALILASAFNPLISWLHERKIPKTLSVLSVYITFLSVIVVTILLTIPPVTDQFGQLIKLFPGYYQKMSDFFVNYMSTGTTPINSSLSSNVGNSIGGIVSSVFSTTFQIFGGIFAFITVLIMSFYFAIEENAIKKFVNSIIPSKHQPYVVNLFSKIQEKLGQWFRGQIILSLIIFVITFIGLLSLGVKYYLILAILAGVFEIIPYFGPWISGGVAVFLAFTQDPMKALFVLILYLVVQQLENSVIVPKVMGKSVGLNPLVVIIAILVGFKLAGVVGGLIAVPIAAAISVFVTDFLDKRA